METVGNQLRTVFLDRDGVINRKQREGKYVTSWGLFEFLPGVIEAIRLLNAAGVRVIVVTNQRGVARGLMSSSDLRHIHHSMVGELRVRGAAIDGLYVCAHDDGACACRKPQIGMFLRARQDFPDVEPASAAVVGDSLSDLVAAQRLGARAFLVATYPDRRHLVSRARERGIAIDGVGPSLLDIVKRHVLPVADGLRVGVA
jgi:D-glycero-D-manno-heptose 1,7-bisphosphate phosphatase